MSMETAGVSEEALGAAVAALDAAPAGDVDPARFEQLRAAARRRYTAGRNTAVRIAGSLDLAPGARVLELGSEYGVLTLELARRGYSVVALEPSPAARHLASTVLQEVAPPGDVQFLAMGANALAELEGPFDAAVSDRGLTHVDFEIVVEQLARLLSPSARLVAAFVGEGIYAEAAADAIAARRLRQASERLLTLVHAQVARLGAVPPAAPRPLDPEAAATILSAYGFEPGVAVEHRKLGLPTRVAVDAAFIGEPAPVDPWTLVSAGAPRAALRVAETAGEVDPVLGAVANARAGLLVTDPPAGSTPSGIPAAALVRFALRDWAGVDRLCEEGTSDAAHLLRGAALLEMGRSDLAAQVAASAPDEGDLVEALAVIRTLGAVNRGEDANAWRSWADFLRARRERDGAAAPEINTYLTRLANVDGAPVARGEAEPRDEREQSAAPPVTVRSTPLPFKAMLAISSDIDQMSIYRFREVHRFLHTREETPAGVGLGLDVGDTFWFYRRIRGLSNPELAEMAYFDGLDWSTPSSSGEEILHYIRAGWIDALHTYGNFSGISDPAAQFTREHAERGLEVLSDAGVQVKVWINHGDRHNRQNIGGQQYMQGAVPSSTAYHADLLRDAGIEFLWESSRTGVFGEPSKLNLVRLEDGKDAWFFSRFYTAPYADATGHGLEAGAAEQMARTKPHAVLWHPAYLHVQLSDAYLGGLVERRELAIVAQHLGAARPLLHFGAPAVAALRRLSAAQDRGEILVARTSRLLEFNRARDFVRFDPRVEEGRLVIDIQGIDDPVAGFLPPTIERLRGLTFEADRPATLLLDGTPPAERDVVHGQEDGRELVGIAWHEPDYADHAAEFRSASKRPVSRARGFEPRSAEDVAGAALTALDEKSPLRAAWEEGIGGHARLFRELGLAGMGLGADLGPGDGRASFAYLLENARVAPVTSDAELGAIYDAIAEAAGLGPRLEVAAGSPESVPLGDAGCATAWLLDASSVADPELAFREVARILEQGGSFYCGHTTLDDALRRLRRAAAAPDLDAVAELARGLMAALLMRAGVPSTPWRPFTVLDADELVLGTGVCGLALVDYPGLARIVPGAATSGDVLARRDRALGPLETVPDGPEAEALLQRLVEIGFARTAADAMAAQEKRRRSAESRRLYLRALVRAGRGDSPEAASLLEGESDPLLRYAVELGAGRYREAAAALERKRRIGRESEGGALSPAFLRGAALLAAGEPDEARQELERGAGDLGCLLGLVEAAAREKDGTELETLLAGIGE
jgi:SAM-dependent methyltransferase